MYFFFSIFNLYVTQMDVTKYIRNTDSLQYYGLLYDSHLLGQNRRHLDELTESAQHLS